jgi:hypothetical protein
MRARRRWNHAPRQIAFKTFEVVRGWYEQTLRAKHSHITDPLSGNQLEILEQSVAIALEGNAEVNDAFALSAWLQRLHSECRKGADTPHGACALLTGRPASGKTTLMSQLVVHTLNSSSELVPIVIRLQQLQRYLRDGTPPAFSTSWNWIDAYLKARVRSSHPWPCPRRGWLVLSPRHVWLVLSPRHVWLVLSARSSCCTGRRGSTARARRCT